MQQTSWNRRDFIKNTALVTGGLLSRPQLAQASIFNPPTDHVLPRWKGFNFLDFFSPDPANAREGVKEEYFKWMADWGFDFVRLPMAYPFYLKFDRTKPIELRRIRKMDKRAVEKIEEFVFLAHKYNLHVSLNLHRAPGFCVNAGFEEPYNLWQDEQAMDDFCHHWKFWAKRFRNGSRDKISFDLLNEPCLREDMNDQHSKRSAIPGALYRKMAEAASHAIRSVKPDALIIADGNNVGNQVIPEITDLDIAQSCRGYFPGIISHYKAPWAMKDTENLPEVKWPGQVGEQYLSRDMLENYYAPWIELKNQGVGVHCGECGCWNKTPHDVFLAWFGDILSIFKENGIGFALWEFKGSFGILNSGRTDVAYEDWYGLRLDRKLLKLLMEQ
ncbi:MAG: cellulase family glycosylhydrolase [Saprospiraceae bacterium]|nr:cellulase family glycosylhydrolase [Lewinella sp.]